MTFTIRRVGRYKEVIVQHECTTIDLGLLDDKERLELAKTLREAADEVADGLIE